VVEIYDLLSNSIENGGRVARMACLKEGLRQDGYSEEE
jgi:hypothetical protein